MKNDDKEHILVRRITATDMDAALGLVSQIRSPEDLVASAHSQFVRELDASLFEEARFVAESYGGM